VFLSLSPCICRLFVAYCNYFFVSVKINIFLTLHLVLHRPVQVASERCKPMSFWWPDVSLRKGVDIEFNGKDALLGNRTTICVYVWLSARNINSLGTVRHGRLAIVDDHKRLSPQSCGHDPTPIKFQSTTCVKKR
jgi:hypothetical protein